MDEWTSGRVVGYVREYAYVLRVCMQHRQAGPGAENKTVRWRRGGMDGWDLWGGGNAI